MKLALCRHRSRAWYGRGHALSILEQRIEFGVDERPNQPKVRTKKWMSSEIVTIGVVSALPNVVK